jgi:hypothetical protein
MDQKFQKEVGPVLFHYAFSLAGFFIPGAGIPAPGAQSCPEDLSNLQRTGYEKEKISRPAQLVRATFWDNLVGLKGRQVVKTRQKSHRPRPTRLTAACLSFNFEGTNGARITDAPQSSCPEKQ